MAKKKVVTKAEAAVRNPEIIRLRDEGLWPLQIVEQLGVSRAAVKAVLARAGKALTPEEEASPAYLDWRHKRQMAAADKRAEAQGGRTRDKVLALKQRGYSKGLIAQALGIAKRRYVTDFLNEARKAAKAREQT